METTQDSQRPARVTPDAKKLLNGKSPHERGQEKVQIVCRWVYHHGTSTAEIINAVSGQKAPGYAKKLVDKGLLVASQTISGSPKLFYTLSKAGLNLASEFSLTPIDYKCLSPSKLSQTLFDHNFAVQKIYLAARKKHPFKYQSQAQLALKHNVGVKIPDAVWIDKDEKRIAIEVEFSQKHGRQLDMMIHAMKDSLENDEYSCYFIFARSQAVIKNYSNAISRGQVVDYWAKNRNGNWVVDEDRREKVPDWLASRVFFFDIEQPFKDPRDLAFGL
jgi:hypothetical protein